MQRSNATIHASQQLSGDVTKVRAMSTGLLAFLAAITMLFAAFTSAYVVRRGLSNDWVPLSLPGILMLTPLLLIAGSGCLEIGRRQSIPNNVFRNCCLGAALLGMLFLALQVYGWMDLSKNGVQMSTHPAAAFFYIFSGLFGVFVLGGIVASIWKGLQRVLHSKNVVYYWHYLSVLWLYLLGLLYWGK